MSVGGERELGYWGEVLTTAAQARGLAGLVIDGGVRDVDALQRLGFPAFSAMVALRGATKLRPGSVGGSTTVGDVEVRTGDWIVADVDGVTVVPADRAQAVLDTGRARAAKETKMFDDLRAGRTTIDLLALDPTPIERDY